MRQQRSFPNIKFPAEPESIRAWAEIDRVAAITDAVMFVNDEMYG